MPIFHGTGVGSIEFEFCKRIGVMEIVLNTLIEIFEKNLKKRPGLKLTLIGFAFLLGGGLVYMEWMARLDGSH